MKSELFWPVNKVSALPVLFIKPEPDKSEDITLSEVLLILNWPFTMIWPLLIFLLPKDALLSLLTFNITSCNTESEELPLRSNWPSVIFTVEFAITLSNITLPEVLIVPPEILSAIVKSEFSKAVKFKIPLFLISEVAFPFVNV